MSIIEGAGIGLRPNHFEAILAQAPDALWFEVLVDNFLADGGLNQDMLFAVAERYPIVLHGVGLSVGGSHAIDEEYVRKIAHLKTAIGAHWYSEHLSFSGNQHFRVPDLLPLPYTEESLKHVVARIRQVQDLVGERILIENVSTYLQFPHNEMSEPEFLREVAIAADSHILLDLNNVFVTGFNSAEDPEAYLAAIPLERVKQVHLAGYADKGSYLLDAHNNPVSVSVWSLFERFLAMAGARPTLVEWDNDIPSLDRLLGERTLAQQRLDRIGVATVGA